MLAVLLGLLNSLVRPLYRVKAKPGMAIGEAVATVLFNTLVLQIVIWAGGPLSATSVAWVLATAAFLTLLGGLINWLIGFKEKRGPPHSCRSTETPEPQQVHRRSPRPNEVRTKRSPADFGVRI